MSNRKRAGAPGGKSSRGSSLENWLVAPFILMATGLYLLPINRYSGNYDEGVYWQSLRALTSGHPLFTAVFSSQPPYFLTSLAPFYQLLGQDIAAARFGVAVFALLGVVAMFWLGAQLGGTGAGLLAAALLAFEPLYLQQARTLEADGPAVAVSILAVALAAAARRASGALARRWLAAMSGAVLVYALLIKLFALVALVPILLCLAAPVFRVFATATTATTASANAFAAGADRRRWPRAAALRQGARAALPDLPDLAGLAAGALAAALLLLAPFRGSFAALWDQVITFHLAAQNGPPVEFAKDFATTMASFTLLFLLALAALGLAVWRRAWRMAIPLAWLLSSLLLLSRLTSFFTHYAVLVTPGVALLIALAPGLLTPVVSRPAPSWLRGALTLAILSVLLVNVVIDLTTSQATLSRGVPASARTQLAALNAFTLPGELVVTDDPYLAAQAGHSVPPELVDDSRVRIQTGSLTTPELERIIERDHVRVVVVANDRLPSLPGFMPWLLQRYALAGRVGAQFAIYIRVASTSGVA